MSTIPLGERTQHISTEMPFTIIGLENDIQNHRAAKRDFSHALTFLTLSLLSMHDKGVPRPVQGATELNPRRERFNQLQARLRLVERNAPLVEGTVDAGMTHLYICMETEVTLTTHNSRFQV